MNLKFIVASFLSLLYFSSAQQKVGSLCQVSNCRQCSGTDFCGLCQDNYILQTNIQAIGTYCQPVVCNISNCASCLRDHICEFCEVGYKLGINGRCQQAHQLNVKSCPQNCLACEAEVCSVCRFGLSLKDGVCSALEESSIFGCRSYLSKQFCQLCIEGYLVQPDGSCKSNKNYLLQLSTQNIVQGVQCNITDCIYCVSPNFCGECSGNLSVNVGGYLCVECTIANCSLCQQNNSCQICLPGYQLNVEGECQALIPCDILGCQQCEINNNTIQCIACQIFFTLTSYGNCSYCEQPCSVCANGSTVYCDTCFQPLNNIDGVCYTCTVAFCASCPSNLTICESCTNNYMLNNNACVPQGNCSIFCQTCYSFDQECGQCYPGYVQSQVDSADCLLCTARYCMQCQPSNLSACQSCNLGFYLNANNICMPCPYTNCLMCTATSCQQFQNIRILTYDGQLVPGIVDPGCSLTSDYVTVACTTCLPGFTLNSNRLCIPCTYPCMECDPTTPSVCVSCYPNAFLSESTCLTCTPSSNCFICQPSNLSACLSCPQGSLLNPVTLVCTPNSCPPFCEVCLSATICSSCILGYSKNMEGQCLPCVNNCQKCPDNNQGQCEVECGEFGGFYIDIVGNCVQCPSFCAQCYNQGCILCLEGYYLAPNLACMPKCTYPCASCSLSFPSMCTLCYAGYILNSANNSCIPQTSNCSNGSCYYCPLGFIVTPSYTCIQCTPNSNCARCNPNNLSSCLTCVNGYYLNGTTCVSCPQGCRQCLSDTFCFTCQTGYLILQQSYLYPAICVACESPCAACTSTPNNCLTCIEGYSLNGWNCQSNFYFIFSITLQANQTEFYSNYGSLLTALVGPLNNNNNIGAVTVTSITTENNSIITGTLSTTQQPYTSGVSTQYYSLTSLLGGSTIGNMNIQSYSLEASNGEDFSNGSNGPNLGLILGICIPILIIIIVIIVVLVYRRYKSQNSNPESNMSYRQLTSSYKIN